MDSYYKLQQLFCYKVRHKLLRIEKGYNYKMLWLTNCDSTTAIAFFLRWFTWVHYLESRKSRSCTGSSSSQNLKVCNIAQGRSNHLQSSTILCSYYKNLNEVRLAFSKPIVIAVTFRDFRTKMKYHDEHHGWLAFWKECGEFKLAAKRKYELEEFSLTVTILLVSQEFAVTGILVSWKVSCRKDYCEETPS